MATRNTRDQQEVEVVVEEKEPEGKQPEETRTPKKALPPGKHHRTGPRHRENRTRGYFHLLEPETDEVFS